MIRINLSAVALALVAVSLFAALASAAPCTTNRVLVRNSGEHNIWAQVFNNDDDGYVSPVAQKLLGPGSTAELTCNTCGNCLGSISLPQSNPPCFGVCQNSFLTGPPSDLFKRLGYVTVCVTVTDYKPLPGLLTWSAGC